MASQDLQADTRKDTDTETGALGVSSEQGMADQEVETEPRAPRQVTELSSQYSAERPEGSRRNPRGYEDGESVPRSIEEIQAHMGTSRPNISADGSETVDTVETSDNSAGLDNEDAYWGLSESFNHTASLNSAVLVEPRESNARLQINERESHIFVPQQIGSSSVGSVAQAERSDEFLFGLPETKADLEGLRMELRENWEQLSGGTSEEPRADNSIQQVSNAPLSSPELISTAIDHGGSYRIESQQQAGGTQRYLELLDPKTFGSEISWSSARDPETPEERESASIRGVQEFLLQCEKLFERRQFILYSLIVGLLLAIAIATTVVFA